MGSGETLVQPLLHTPPLCMCSVVYKELQLPGAGPQWECRTTAAALAGAEGLPLWWTSMPRRGRREVLLRPRLKFGDVQQQQGRMEPRLHKNVPTNSRRKNHS